MITVKLISPVVKDTQDYGYREGNLRLTVRFQHDDKEVKCIVLPSTDVDGKSYENYYDGEPVAFSQELHEQITDHLSEKLLQGFFDDKPIGFEYSFEF